MTHRSASPSQAFEIADNVRAIRLDPPAEPFPIPIVMLPSLFNRFQVFDLHPNRTFAGFLHQHDLDVWIVDWGEPVGHWRGPDFEDYTDRYLEQVLNVVEAKTGAGEVSLLGYSLGGVFAVISASLHPDRIRNLITLTTPVDTWKTGIVAAWSQVFPVEVVVGAIGRIPAWAPQVGFWTLALPRLDRLWKAFSADLRTPEDRDVLKAVGRWVRDSVPFSGPAYRTLVRDVYRRNGLLRGMTVGDKHVDISKITANLLTITASEDHLCPPESSYALNERVGSADQTSLTVPGGHLGAVIGKRARTVLWTRIVDWLVHRSGHAPAGLIPGGVIDE